MSKSPPLPDHVTSAEAAGALLAEQQASGETIAAFARRIGVSASALYTWRSRFGHSRSRSPKARAPSDPFVPVRVVDDERPVHALAGGQSGFELILGGSTTLLVPHGLDAAELARLLEVLARC